MKKILGVLGVLLVCALVVIGQVHYRDSKAYTITDVTALSVTTGPSPYFLVSAGVYYPAPETNTVFLYRIRGSVEDLLWSEAQTSVTSVIWYPDGITYFEEGDILLFSNKSEVSTIANTLTIDSQGG